MMGWYGDGVGWVGWIMMTLVMIIFWGSLILGGVALFSGRRRSGSSDLGADPQRLLDERFARGDIDAEDYERRRGLLGSAR